MATKRMLPDEIKLLRKTLRMSDGEFAEKIELDDRRKVKQLESGALKPDDRASKLMMKMLQQNAGRMPALKRLLEKIRKRLTEFGI